MTIKQLKKRLVRSMVEPELIYMPVEEKKGKEPFMFNINVINNTTDISILSSIGTTTFWNGTLYNLKDANGIPVTIETYPELFWDRPYNEITMTNIDTGNETGIKVITQLDIIHLSTNMVQNVPELFLTVDWGDGTRDTYHSIDINNWYEAFPNSIQQFIFTNNFTCDAIPTLSNYGKHKYEENGEYKITVTGYDDSVFIDYQDDNFKLLDVYSFGDLNRIACQNMFSRVLKDMTYMPKINFNYLTRVVNVINMFSNPLRRYDNSWYEDFENLKFNWEDIGGDNFFTHFPNLIYANNCFQSCGISYVPDYCFTHNVWLQDISGCFQNCELEYVGNYACANLQYLRTASSAFECERETTEDWLSEKFRKQRLFEYIGESIFENCVQLEDVTDCFNSYITVTSTDPIQIDKNTYSNIFYIGWRYIKDKAFKNCQKAHSSSNICGFGLNNKSVYNLISIGDEVFAGCDTQRRFLDTSAGSQREAQFPCTLQNIGDDCFKDCKNISNFSLWGAISLHNIPEKLLYDIEYQNGMTYYISPVPFEYLFTYVNSPNYPDVRNIGLSYFLKQIYRNSNGLADHAFGHIFSTQFYQEFFPEIIERLTEVQQDFPKNVGFHWGKNMFNNRFLQQVGSFTQFSYFVCMNYTNTYSDDGVWTQQDIYNLTTGEAPPFWEYDIRWRLGEEVENGFIIQNGVNITSNKLQYDNETEIPRDPTYWVWTYKSE